MNFKDIIAVSGLSGLYKSISQRPNGMIVSLLGESGSTKFVSNRKHTFTSLDNISIYTEQDDNIILKDVFKKMKEQEKTTPVINHKANSAELKDYFKQIVPEFDEERVYVSDIKKVIKWFGTLNELNLLDFTEEEQKEEKTVEEDSSSGDTAEAIATDKEPEKKVTDTAKKPASKKATPKTGAKKSSESATKKTTPKKTTSTTKKSSATTKSTKAKPTSSSKAE